MAQALIKPFITKAPPTHRHPNGEYAGYIQFAPSHEYKETVHRCASANEFLNLPDLVSYTYNENLFEVGILDEDLIQLREKMWRVVIALLAKNCVPTERKKAYFDNLEFEVEPGDIK